MAGELHASIEAAGSPEAADAQIDAGLSDPFQARCVPRCRACARPVMGASIEAWRTMFYCSEECARHFDADRIMYDVLRGTFPRLYLFFCSFFPPSQVDFWRIEASENVKKMAFFSSF